MRRKPGCIWGKLAVAFGVGLIVAFILPPTWLVAILAITLIVFGLVCLK